MSQVATAAAPVAAAVAKGFSVQIPTGSVEALLHNGKLVIACPREPELRPSSSKKTLLVASTGGFKETDHEIQGQKVRVNFTAYVYPDGASKDGNFASGQVKFEVPPVGQPPKVVVTKEMVIVAVDAAEPRESSTGKMMLISPAGGNIVSDVKLGEQNVRINFTAGFYKPRA